MNTPDPRLPVPFAAQPATWAAEHSPNQPRRLSALARFYEEERGELPVSYLAGLVTALMLIFFVIDVGLRLGARQAVENAATCAARAAATQLPRGDEEGATVNDDKLAVLRHAAAACLAAVAKRNGLGPLTSPGQIERVIENAEAAAEVRVLDLSGEPRQRFAHNQTIEVEVSYRYDLLIPFSPLTYLGVAQQPMRARARTMLHTIK